MVYRGTYKNGVVVLDEKEGLEEGQRVRVDVVPLESPETGESTVSQELLKLAGRFRTGRKDGSRNHDHYISGAPKREPET